jgi:hypothetical protein
VSYRRNVALLHEYIPLYMSEPLTRRRLLACAVKHDDVGILPLLEPYISGSGAEREDAFRAYAKILSMSSDAVCARFCSHAEPLFRERVFRVLTVRKTKAAQRLCARMLERERDASTLTRMLYALTRADDPSVRRVLTAISAGEGSHAPEALRTLARVLPHYRRPDVIAQGRALGLSRLKSLSLHFMICNRCHHCRCCAARHTDLSDASESFFHVLAGRDPAFVAAAAKRLAKKGKPTAAYARHAVLARLNGFDDAVFAECLAYAHEDDLYAEHFLKRCMILARDHHLLTRHADRIMTFSAAHNRHVRYLAVRTLAFSYETSVIDSMFVSFARERDQYVRYAYVRSMREMIDRNPLALVLLFERSKERRSFSFFAASTRYLTEYSGEYVHVVMDSVIACYLTFEKEGVSRPLVLRMLVMLRRLQRNNRAAFVDYLKNDVVTPPQKRVVFDVLAASDLSGYPDGTFDFLLGLFGGLSSEVKISLLRFARLLPNPSFSFKKAVYDAVVTEENEHVLSALRSISTVWFSSGHRQGGVQ